MKFPRKSLLAAALALAACGGAATNVGTGKSAIEASQSPWTHCAPEGGTCLFNGPAEVRYGANGVYNVMTFDGGAVRCTNDVFGDPTPGVIKDCDIRWMNRQGGVFDFCAMEGGACSFEGTGTVRYGANGTWAYRNVTDGTPCNNEVFGDPVPGFRKSCELAWTLAASEGGYFFANFSPNSSVTVRYGSAGFFSYQEVSTYYPTPFYCTNETMGGNPLPGSMKFCLVPQANCSGPNPPPADYYFCCYSDECGECARWEVDEGTCNF
ncbi:MAG: hypothetical protein QM765_35710 [Myxococcales bacterium]